MTEVFTQHCIRMYKALDERATTRTDDDGSPERVFIGAVSPIYKSLKISQTYYGPIFQCLEDVGAILKVQQGARGIDTVILLRGLPNVWPEGLGWKGDRSVPLTEDSRYARILLEVQEMKGSIGGINVVLALQELEQRVVALERQLLKMEGKSAKK